jgi:membrane-bound lytic murein transglycosylase D
LLLAGCSISNRPQRFTNHFVPPASVKAEPVRIVEEPPALDLYVNERPMDLAQARAAPQTSVELQLRLSRAQELFETGSALFIEGKQSEGRERLDQALGVLASAPGGLPQRDRLVKRYAQMVEAIHRLEVEAAGQSPGGAEPVFDKAPLEDIVEMTFPMEPDLRGKVLDQLRATESQLPLEIADPVLRYINYFSSPKGKRRIEFGLRRAGRYSGMIKKILDEEGLPQELIFLAQAESAFLPRAVSRKRATGMWQFMQARGREYGLLQTPSTDDRLDPEKATRAAARHLRDLYRQFGDWYLAVAAYNCGPGNVERAIQRTGYADFWEIHKRRVLPAETANHLPIILAMTIMAKNPKDYGLEGITPEAPLAYDTITLDAATHLGLVADLADTPLQTIRELNPAVLKLVAPLGYQVHVPKGSGGQVMASLEAIPTDRQATWRVHRVNPSETVAAIARQYNTSLKSIAAANGVASAELDPDEGDLLLIPVSYPGASTVSSRTTRVRSKTPVRAAKKPVAKARGSRKATPVLVGQASGVRAEAASRR